MKSDQAFLIANRHRHASVGSILADVAAFSRLLELDDMNKTMLTIAAAALLSLAVLLPIRLAAQQARYRLIDLTPGSQQGTEGQGDGPGISQFINGAGVVVGGAGNALGTTHAFRWQQGVLTDLGALGADPSQNFSHAMSVNAYGWATGGSSIDSFDALLGQAQERAVLWTRTEIINLGTLGTGIESAGEYVTNAGAVVGFSTVNTTIDPWASIGLSPNLSPTHAFIWQNGVMQDLGTLGGPDSFVGGGCNNQSGSVVGSSFTSSTPNPATGFPPLHPYVWKNGKMQGIDPLAGGTLAVGQCGNDQGQVIGFSTLNGDQPGSASPPGQNGFQTHPFLWDPLTGTTTDLGTLGGDSGQAFWINNAGDVVGVAEVTGSVHRHAFLWTHGTMKDLKTLGGNNSTALSINSQGQIIGRSRTSGKRLHAFLSDNGAPMVDLNSLIPPNSGLELAEADNINDRGEIVGLGLPSGCNDINDGCGHFFLLIPCGASGAACQGAPAPAALVPTNSPIKWPFAGIGTIDRATAVAPRSSHVDRAAKRTRDGGH